MAWFSKQKNEVTRSDFAALHSMISGSFSNVKNDTSQLFQWINYMQKKIAEQDKKIDLMQHQLEYAPDQKQQIKEVIDDYYNYHDLVKHVNQVTERINHISSSNFSQNDGKVSVELVDMKQRIMDLESKKQDIKQSLKEKLVKKITRNSHDYVKSMVLSMIRKYETISALQLKDMVVDEQGLVSKSSFYRILQELESESEVNFQKDGKIKTYFSQISKQAVSERK